jgi:site-specific DNA-methyltransferase (adenine-specific)
MGSGTTGVGCINTKRKFIGIELNEKYYKLSKNRIKNIEHIEPILQPQSLPPSP